MERFSLPLARDEYLKQLEAKMMPEIKIGIQSIYKKAEDTSENEPYNKILFFQQFLKGVPAWNDTILKRETDRIIEKIPMFKKLVITIILSNVTILSSIKFKRSSDSNIKVTIPLMTCFVHSIYRKVARELYYNPEFIENEKELEEIICRAIEDAISACIPINEILDEYLGDQFDTNTHVIKMPGSEDTDDSEEDSEEDSEKDSEKDDEEDSEEDSEEEHEEPIAEEKHFPSFNSANPFTASQLPPMTDNNGPQEIHEEKKEESDEDSNEDSDEESDEDSDDESDDDTSKHHSSPPQAPIPNKFNNIGSDHSKMGRLFNR